MIKFFDNLFKTVSAEKFKFVKSRKHQNRKPRIILTDDHSIFCHVNGTKIKILNINQGGMAFRTNDFRERPKAKDQLHAQLIIEDKTYSIECEIVYVRNQCGAKIINCEIQAVNHLLKYLKIEILAQGLYQLNPEIVKQVGNGKTEMYLGHNCELTIKYSGETVLEISAAINEDYFEYKMNGEVKIGKISRENEEPFKYKSSDIINEVSTNDRKDEINKFKKFISNSEAIEAKTKSKLLKTLSEI